MRKILSFCLILTISIAICACSNKTQSNTSATENSSQSSTQGSTSMLEENEESTLSYKKISSIEELNLNNITKVTAYVLDEEISTEDKDIIEHLCNTLKKLTPNNDTEAPISYDKHEYEGFTEVFAYNGDTLIYDFVLVGEQNNQKLLVSDNKSYFYFDISSEVADEFYETYKHIYKLTDIQIENVTDDATNE